MAAELSPHLRVVPMPPNQVLAGPATGTAASPPNARALVAADFVPVVAANLVLAGPTSGAAAAASFRAQVYADQPVSLPRISIDSYLYAGGL